MPPRGVAHFAKLSWQSGHFDRARFFGVGLFLAGSSRNPSMSMQQIAPVSLSAHTLNNAMLLRTTGGEPLGFMAAKNRHCLFSFSTKSTDVNNEVFVRVRERPASRIVRSRVCVGS